MMEALSMGEHGLYVWLAYGISFAVLIGLGLRPRLAMRKFRRQNVWRQNDGSDVK